MLLFLCLLLPPPAEGEWQDLFNGKDLTGWVREARDRKDGIPKWTVTPAGELKSEAGLDGFGFLRYDQAQFGDFVLRLEYRFEPEAIGVFKGNSGVGIRTGKFDPSQSSATRPSFSAFEVQLLDDAGKPASKHSTASLYRYAGPVKNTSKPAPEWNKLEVRCVGPKIRIHLNDEEVLDADQTKLADLASKPKSAPAPKDKPTRGFISLQSHTGTVLFRKIQIQKLH